MFLIILSFLVIVLFYIIYLYLYFKNSYTRKHLSSFPGPKPIIFYGNTHVVANVTEFLNTVMRLSQEYGELFKVRVGPFRYVLCVSDQKVMEYILSSTKNIQKSKEYSFIEPWLGTGLLTSGGTKWKTRRRMLTPAFHFSILEQFISCFENVGKILIKKLEKEVDKDSFDIYPLITLCTLDVIVEATMGTSVNAQENEDSEYVRSVKEVCRIIISRTFSVLKNFDALFPFSLDYYRQKNALKVLHAFSNGVIDKRIRDMKNKQDNADKVNHEGTKQKLAFLDLILQSTIDQQPLSREDIREEVDTFMFEGHDTTASALGFALYMLSKHSDVQEKVLMEQRAIFGNERDAATSYKHLQEMKYLELVIKETLRLYPSVPLFSRLCTEDIQFNDQIIPKGTTLGLFIFGMHRNPKYFKDPESFIPERFDEYLKEHSPYVYVPFSAGPRNCIGQKFAMLEMKSLISKIVRNFVLLEARPEHELQLSAEMILISLNGIHLSLKKREH